MNNNAPIFFDMMNTFIDVLGERPSEEARAYIKQCVDPMWRPLELPKEWETIKAFPDAAEGFKRLGAKYRCIVLSNVPVDLTAALINHNRLPLRHIIDLEDIQRYKPHPECYRHACKLLEVEPHEAMMVTANPTFGPYPFGDIQIAGAIGMQTRLIRQPGGPADLIALAEELGC